MNKIIKIIIAAGVSMSILIPTANVSANSIEEYEEEIKKIEKEKNNLNNKKNEVNNNKKSVANEKGKNKEEQMSVEEQMQVITKEVNETEKKLTEKSNEIKQTNSEIKELEAEIKQLNDEIKELKIRIKEREDMLTKRLKSIQEVGGEVQYLEVILGAKSFSDLISRSTAVNTVMDSDKVIMEEHAKDKKALETKEKQVQENKKSLEKKRKNQVKEKEKLADLKKELTNQKKKQAKIKAELEEKYEDLVFAELTLEEEEALIAGEASALEQAKQVAKNEKTRLENAERKRIAEEKIAKKKAERKAAQRQIAKQEAKENKVGKQKVSSQSVSKNSKSTEKVETNTKDVSNSVTTVAAEPKTETTPKPTKKPSGGGSFIRPASGAVSSEFSPNRVHPLTGKVAAHKGIDVRASTGTPVYAAASGVISSAGYNNGGYGNRVMITHHIDGKTYTTLYAHLNSISVKSGQVSRGQKIGTIGSTGDSSGPHLHFEIHSGGYGNPVNPRNHISF